jgi:hypothetical protein
MQQVVCAGILGKAVRCVATVDLASWMTALLIILLLRDISFFPALLPGYWTMIAGQYLVIA